MVELFRRWGRALSAALLVGAGLLAHGHATMPPAQVVQVVTTTRTVVTEGNNVYLTDGAHQYALTTRGTGPTGVWYPWYSWSSDGQYLLLVRETTDPARFTRREDLLLLDRRGAVLRTLGHPSPDADFGPTWARDGGHIAYLAPGNSATTEHVVEGVDLRGNTHVLWRYTAAEGCGGGTADPAEALLWQEVGYEGRAPTLEWSIAGHRALYSAACIGGINTTDTHTGRTYRLRTLTDEATANPAVPTLVAGSRPAPRDVTSRLVLARLSPGGDTLVRTLGLGELPRWSRDGRTLYFVRRVSGAIYRLHDESGNLLNLRSYTSAIWRARGDGTGAQRLLVEDAYAFGPLQLTPDGRALVFARIANNEALWRHRLPGNRVNSALLRRYPPTVSVQRLDLTAGRVQTLVAHGGRPAVQP